MFDLIKYELKGMKNFIYAILISIAVMCLLILAKVNLLYGLINSASGALIGLVILIIAFINSIKIFSKYLYEDDGYLLFTLPVNGYEIVGSRLIFAFIQLTVVILALVILAFATTSKLLNFIPDIKTYVSYFITPLTVGYGIVEYIINIGVLLCSIYFSMVLGKTILKLKKHEKGAAFLTFIVVNIIINYAKGLVDKLWVLYKPINIPNGFDINTGIFGSNFSISNSTISFDMGLLILNIILFAALFIGTSKLIDKGIEK